MLNVDSKTVAIAWLSIQLTVVSWLWVRAEKRASYLQGFYDTYQTSLQITYEGCAEDYSKNKGYYPHEKITSHKK